MSPDNADRRLEHGNARSPFRLEHSAIAYRTDFAVYGASVVLLSAFLACDAPSVQRTKLAALTLGGLVAWTLIEYVMHRFVMHGMEPFRSWHELHHRRPKALIFTPAILNGLAILLLLYLPALLLSDRWHACAVTLGIVTGYLGYSVVHHTTHHCSRKTGWLKRRRQWHARHHRSIANPGHYGVTTAIWDHVFGTAGEPGITRPLTRRSSLIARLTVQSRRSVARTAIVCVLANRPP